MKDYYTLFYVEANIVCIIIFILMLMRSIRGVDHQAKQRIFNIVLMCNINYFICDSFWILVLNGYLLKNLFTVSLVNCGNSILLMSICCFWYIYVEMNQKVISLENRITRLHVQLPAIILSLINVFLFIFFPSLMIDENFEQTLLYIILFIPVPIFYIFAGIIRSLARAIKTDNPDVRSTNLTIMFYGVAVVIFGVLQMIGLDIPIFCFGCTITMIYMYLASLDDLVSLDPLTSLNNRAQLNRYVYQELQHQSDATHYVIMFDLNDFKNINDHYGHIEGDRAIIKAAEIIKTVCGKDKNRPFIARYGGDEFIAIVRTENEEEVIALSEAIRNGFKENNDNSDKEYELSCAIGHASFCKTFKDFLEAINKADEMLYEEKKKYHYGR